MYVLERRESILCDDLAHLQNKCFHETELVCIPSMYSLHSSGIWDVRRKVNLLDVCQIILKGVFNLFTTIYILPVAIYNDYIKRIKYKYGIIC